MMKSNTFLAGAVGVVLLGAFWLAPGAGWAVSTDYLYIEPRTSQQVRYVAGGVEVAEAISTLSGTKCVLDQSDRPDGSGGLNDLVLITADGSNQPPGWRRQNLRLGVNGGAKGDPCTEVRNAQAIWFRLGGDSSTPGTPKGDGQKIIKVSIELEVEKTVDVVVELLFADEIVYTRPSETCAIGGCTNIEITEATAGGRWDEVRIRNASDAGNAESGAFSVVNVTFEMIAFVPEGYIGCGGKVYEQNGTFKRLTIAEGCGAGAELPYSYDYDGTTSVFLVDKSPEFPAEFVFEETSAPGLVKWPATATTAFPPTAASSPNPPLSASTFVQAVPLSVQWFANAGEKYFLDYCPGGPTGDTTLEFFTGWTFPSDFNKTPGSAFDMSTEAGFQYGCMVRREINVLNPAACFVLGGDETATSDEVCIQIISTGYVIGDYTRLRGF